MNCLEHGQETNYLSIFDPRTIEWYDHFYKNLTTTSATGSTTSTRASSARTAKATIRSHVPDWINMGHCHEGYWCADEYAIKAFRPRWRTKYGDVAKLNRSVGHALESFDDVRPPQEFSQDVQAHARAFPTGQDKRRWLDFITWYHQAIIDFAERSLKTVLKYFPAKGPHQTRRQRRRREPDRLGHLLPRLRAMAQRYGIVLQPADCQAPCSPTNGWAPPTSSTA